MQKQRRNNVREALQGAHWLLASFLSVLLYDSDHCNIKWKGAHFYRKAVYEVDSQLWHLLSVQSDDCNSCIRVLRI